MIQKTNAIALRIYPIRETSRIIVWLTETEGKIATIAKGSQRPRSPLLGQFDLFYQCEILFYPRPASGLHLLKECTPLDWQPRLRTDFRACAAASYTASIVDRAFPDVDVPEPLYAFIRSALTAYANRTPGPASLLRLESRILDLLGLLPTWRVCGACATPLGGGMESTARFLPERGTLLCPHCAKTEGSSISQETLNALHAIRIGRRSAATGLATRVFAQARDILGALLTYHAGISPVPRQIAYQLLGAPLPSMEMQNGQQRRTV